MRVGLTSGSPSAARPFQVSLELPSGELMSKLGWVPAYVVKTTAFRDWALTSKALELLDETVVPCGELNVVVVFGPIGGVFVGGGVGGPAAAAFVGVGVGGGWYC